MLAQLYRLQIGPKAVQLPELAAHVDLVRSGKPDPFGQMLRSELMKDGVFGGVDLLDCHIRIGYEVIIVLAGQSCNNNLSFNDK